MLTAFTAFFERVLAGDLAHCAPTSAEAAGFQVLLDTLQGAPATGHIKGHVTGPVSFGLTVPDHEDRPSFYDDTLREVILQGLAAQARAQCRALARTGRPVILFVDEPYLSAFGSATVPVSEEDVITALDAVFGAILEENAVPAVHCCGNTDWGLLMRTRARIINFDAFCYLEGMTLYPEELRRFLDRDGGLAWGIVPTDAGLIAQVTEEELLGKLRDGLAQVASAAEVDEDLLRSRSLITPACGLGTVSPELAERAIRLTRRVADRFRA